MDRPAANDNGTGDGSGGLNIDLAGASEQTRLRIRGGSNFSLPILDITAVANDKNAIKIYDSIQLAGGTQSAQNIWVKTGEIGSLSYGGNLEVDERLVWGQSKSGLKTLTLN